jgi:hypothetical protein
MITYPVHLPHEEAYTLVYVSPEKTYGGVPGSELIQKYGIKPREKQERIKPEHQELITMQKETALTLSNSPITILGVFLPVSGIPEKIKVSGEEFSYRTLLECVEEITQEKIICKYQNRITKPFQNRTVEMAVLPTEKGLVVFGKGNRCYLIRK